MEIKGSWLAELVGTTRQNIYTLCKQKKLIKSDSGKYNIYTPCNKQFLKTHNKSTLDAEKFIKSKESIVRGRQGRIVSKDIKVKKQPTSKKEQDQSILLVESISYVISKNYSEDEANKIKSEIFVEFERRVKL